MSIEPTVILYLINALPQVGPVNVLESLIRGLDRARFAPHILVLRSEDPSGHDGVFSALGVPIAYLRCSYIDLELRTRRVAERVARHAAAVGAQILHLHGYHPDLIGGQLTGRYITISTQHNISIEDYCLGKGRLLGTYMSFRLWRALARQTAIVGISDRVCAYCSTQLPRGRIYRMYNGVDTQRFRPLPPSERVAERQRLFPNLPADAQMWLVCGSLSRLKAPTTALRAFVHLLSVGALSERDYLVFLGDGPLRSALEQQRGAALQDRVLLLGFRSNVEEYMRVADYLIAPSQSEGFGLGVVEGLLSGLVPVLSDIPAHRELLAPLPRLGGLTFAPTDAHALGERMIEARGLSLRDEERQRIARAFSRETMAGEYMQLYAQLLKQVRATDEKD